VNASSAQRPRPTGWVGWVAFAAVMMMLVGCMNILVGLTALFADRIFVTGADGPLVLDVTGWGWVQLLWGVALAAVGYFLARGVDWAYITAAILVFLNLLGQMLFLPAYPFWALTVMAVDALTLWALIVHGEERLADL